MQPNRSAFVYMMSNRANTVLYVGVTSDLAHRVLQHKAGALGGFTARYQVKKLVYYEACETIDDAIAREKQLKGWRRSKKEMLINGMNPGWDDLAEGW